ncbi:MAG: putative monooxygenase [Myxococcota bacterium]
MTLLSAVLVSLCLSVLGAEPPVTVKHAEASDDKTLEFSAPFFESMDDSESFEIAGGKARAHLVITGLPNYMGVLEGDPGLVVPEHVHAESDELLHVLEGGGWMVIAGKRSRIEAGMMIQIPRGVKHSFMIPPDAKIGFRAVQIYTPAGPEQRFKKGKPIKRPPIKAPPTPQQSDKTPDGSR